MDCAACGQAVSEGAAVCGHCGAAVAKAAEPGSRLRGGFGQPRGLAATEPARRASPRSSQPIASSSGSGRSCSRPRAEWPVIADEASTPQDIYLRYVAPLVAIGVIASFIGTASSACRCRCSARCGSASAPRLAAPILHFVLTFVAVFVVAMIVDALAPTFGGQKDALRALKVTAYSFTPAWVAAILTILPALGVIAGLIGLYGLYLMYLGLPVLMRAPDDKALGYTVVVVFCAIVLSIVVSVI